MKITFHTILKSWKNISNYIFLAVGTMFFFLLNTAVASEPKPWQMDLQEPAGIIATKATDLHNFLLVVITLISVFVLGLLVYVCIKFREKPNVKPSKTSHNTLIEIIWTVVPVLILVVQTDPGPIPTLTISAPASISSWVISAVATFPAIIVALGHFSRNLLTASTNLIVYPFATSRPTKSEDSPESLEISSIPPNQQILRFALLNFRVSLLK